MFGTYTVPFTIETDGIEISLTEEGDGFFYRRSCLEENEEKVFFAENPTVLINPVEPVNKPKKLCSYALLEFSRPLVVEPRTSKPIFLTFPVETGVFVSSRGRDYESFDVFSLNPSKFTLYGDPRSGLICKYWKTDVYSAIPEVAPLQLGVLELSVTNNYTEWVTVTKVVFNAYGMKIFFNSILVYMKGEMEITGRTTARTDFYNTPWDGTMTKSLELYTAKKLPITTTKFAMEYGL